MVKYRLLSTIELNSLEKEFIDFLIVNGITADEWSTIKLVQADKAHHMIALFSDVIFEGIIRKLLYMEFVEPSGIKIFKCESEKILLIGVEMISGQTVDFTDRSLLLEAMKTYPQHFNIYKAFKAYAPDRSTEVFRMIQAGGYVSDGLWFEALNKNNI